MVPLLPLFTCDDEGNTWDEASMRERPLGEIETRKKLNCLKMEALSNHLILERFFEVCELSQVPALRQVCKSFHAFTLSRWQRHFTLGILGSLEPFQDFVDAQQNSGKFPKLGISSVSRELSQAPLTLGLENVKTYQFRKYRVYGMLIRTEKDLQFWKEVGPTLEELTVVNCLYTKAILKTVVQLSPHLQSLGSHYFVPYKRLFVECVGVVGLPQLEKYWKPNYVTKIKHLHFKGLLNSWYDSGANDILKMSPKVVSIEGDWCPLLREKNQVLEWAQAFQPICERDLRKEPGQLWWRSYTEAEKRYEEFAYPIPIWIAKWESEDDEPASFLAYRTFGWPTMPCLTTLSIRLKPESECGISYLLRGLAPTIKNLKVACPVNSLPKRYPESQGFPWHGGINMQLKDEPYDFSVLTQLELSVSLVENLNFLLRTPALQSLVIWKEKEDGEKEIYKMRNHTAEFILEARTWQEHLEVWVETGHWPRFCLDPENEKVQGHTMDKLIAQSGALSKNFAHLNLKHSKANFPIDPASIQILQKWLPLCAFCNEQ